MLAFNRYWYRKSLHWFSIILLPFALIFGLIVSIRQFLYRKAILKTKKFPIPVIVVGNITVGGTGKTPFVIWLAQWLKAQGYRPGIVSRGFGGKKHDKPYWVMPKSRANDVGDEAILLANNTLCPTVVCVNRPAAVSELLTQSNCNIVISDDGLQHYALGRDIEIVLVDGERLFGNKLLLPAGPLREPKRRINSVDFVVVNGGKRAVEYQMRLTNPVLIDLQGTKIIEITEFLTKKIHAVAGIGHPERFFNSLRELGFDIIPHVFSDHYCYQQHDLDFDDTLPVVMTEKDAVKCFTFAKENCWYLKVSAKLNSSFETALLEKIQFIKKEENNNAKKNNASVINNFNAMQ